jgi:PAS domain S-box-containing protein
MNNEDKGKETIVQGQEPLRDRAAGPEASAASHHGFGQALFGNEELYRDVVENIADGIAITVKAERVFVNRAFLTIHGLSDASEVVGHPLDQFVIPEDREIMRERTLARLRGESFKNIVEYRIARPDGEIRAVQASVVMTSYDGEPAVLAVLRDVTSMKQAEMEIVRLNEELQQRLLDLKNANDELETFNATVSHDLRVPLISITGFSQRILTKYGEGLDAKLLEQMRMIRVSAVKMEQLIEELLSYSRLGKRALQQAPIDMNALVQSVVKELRTMYPDGRVRISPLAPCIGDEGTIRQVFANLLANAFKFTSHRKDRLIEVGCTARIKDNVYFVRDNGAGFDANQKGKLFQAFQRLHMQEEFKGTGMGLVIVKRIVGLHGGEVWAEGEPDKGATFYVTLPKSAK